MDFNAVWESGVFELKLRGEHRHSLAEIIENLIKGIADIIHFAPRFFVHDIVAVRLSRYARHDLAGNGRVCDGKDFEEMIAL